MSLFEKKFGSTFLATVPLEPGVYRFHDRAGKVVYVGKAMKLRRRLSQYHLVTSQRRHRKMRKILAAAHTVDFTVCPTHLDACLLEIRLIQELRPRCNVAGAFSFLYPYVGLRWDGTVLGFAFSTKLERLKGYEIFGAFRSRETVGAAFFSLMKLLTYVGHRAKRPEASPQHKGTYEFAFHRLPADWGPSWDAFFKGHSREVLETLTLSLLENVGARSRAQELQEKIDALRVFWEEEAQPLAEAMRLADYGGPYPIPQIERDPLFLRSRLRD